MTTLQRTRKGALVRLIHGAHVRRGGWWRHSGLWALFVWLLCLPAAFALPGLVDQSPFSERGAAVPLVVGAVMLVAVVLLARLWPSPTVTGIAAGAFAGWVVLAMHTGLHGTPYGFIDNDTARLSAMAERYTTTLHSADAIVASVPSEYPPLFPWLVGRVSVLTGVAGVAAARHVRDPAGVGGDRGGLPAVAPSALRASGAGGDRSHLSGVPGTSEAI